MKNLLKHLQKFNGKEVQVQLSGAISIMIQVNYLEINESIKKEKIMGKRVETRYIEFSDLDNEEICDIYVQLDKVQDYSYDGNEMIMFLGSGNMIFVEDMTIY